MGISIWQLLILLVIVVVLFGTKKLRNMGGDLGGAIHGFKKAMKDEENKEDNNEETSQALEDVDIANTENNASDKTS